MKIVRCKRCNRELHSEGSIKLGYGKKCYRIIQLQNTQITTPNNDVIDELLNRVRKLELDNNFMKHQLKHKVFVGKSQDSELNWDLKPEVKKVKDETKIQFTFLIKELKVIFNVDNFDYHNVLAPINVRETPEDPPKVIEIEQLQLIEV